VVNDEIRFQRGPESRLPLLDSGEPAITTDTGKLFFGTPFGNVELPKKDDVNGLSNRVGLLETGKADQSEVDELSTSVGQKAAQTDVVLLFGANGRSVEEFPRIAPEITDSARIQRAITALTAGDVLIFPFGKTYDINTTITITKNIHIIGYGTTLKTVTDGLDNTLDISTATGFSITGLKFDQNLKGRTSINISTSDDWVISDCYFTGYSKEFAYYQTDGGIRVNSGLGGLIKHNKWKDHGYQYGTTTADLNRCISIQGTAERVRIIGNEFDNVNQAIVVTAKDCLVTGNTFVNVKDNDMYIIGVDGLTISGNLFDSKYDECLVFSGRNINISGNVFKDIPNKCFAVNGPSENVTISGNTYESKGINVANILSYRDIADTVVNLTITGNTFRVQGNTMTFEYFGMGNVDNLIFSGNNVDVTTQANQRMLYIQGTTISTGKIANNNFRGTDFTSTTIEVLTATTNEVVYESNRQKTCRGKFSNVIVKGQTYQTNVGPYVLDVPFSMEIFGPSAPTLGKWKTGDIVWNNAPTAGSAKGWRCVSGDGTALGTWEAI
jgi:hypothetical protein